MQGRRVTATWGEARAATVPGTVHVIKGQEPPPPQQQQQHWGVSHSFERMWAVATCGIGADVHGEAATCSSGGEPDGGVEVQTYTDLQRLCAQAGHDCHPMAAQAGLKSELVQSELQSELCTCVDDKVSRSL